MLNQLDLTVRHNKEMFMQQKLEYKGKKNTKERRHSNAHIHAQAQLQRCHRLSLKAKLIMEDHLV